MFSPNTKKLLRWSWRITLATVVLAALAALFWLRGALYDHYTRFPREAADLAALQANRQPVQERTPWNEYRGILHSHSELSHDCEVPFPEILRVLQSTGRDFICLSDHCREGRADFSVQWRGLHEGKLFIPGFEMNDGFMPFGVDQHVILTNSSAPADLAKQIVEHGGVLFYAHPEEPRDWQRPELCGMEIYNIHAEFKRAGGLSSVLPQLLVNQRQYPDLVLSSLLGGQPTQNLQHWDDLNRARHLTGIAGNDCHQNTGARIVCTSLDRLRVEDTSPKVLKEFQLNKLTRWLASLCFGPLEPGRTLWHVQLDSYDRMVRFVSTHLLARELSEPAILEALKAGRAFVGFDALADSSGFLWTAQNASGTAVMGESLAWSPMTHLRAAAPQRCRFTVLKNGKVVHQEQGSRVEWAPPGPGVYRVESHLQIGEEWKPWIYSNPIWLK